jgi:hypothetical protein
MEARGAPRAGRRETAGTLRGARSAWVGPAGEKRGLILRPCRRVDRGTMLAQCFHPTRLETRTKESNMYASRWVANP